MIFVQYLAKKSPQIHTQVINKKNHIDPNHMYKPKRSY
jgi:hypothetical protein